MSRALSRRRRRSLLALLSAAMPAAFAGLAPANTLYYVGPASGPSADWFNSSHWDFNSFGGGAGVVPFGGDDVYIVGTGLSGKSVLFDDNTNPGQYNSVTVSTLGLVGSTLTFAFNSFYNFQTSTFNIGGNGNAGIIGMGTVNQSGSSVFVQNGMTLGNGPGDKGIYNLALTAQLLVQGIEYVGNGGSGTFAQTGGNHSIFSGTLYLGYLTGATGIYTLTNGTLNCASSAVVVGNFGTGAFVQSGGQVNVGQSNIVENFYIGLGSGGTGSYTMNAPAAVLTVSGFESVGYAGTGFSSAGVFTYGGSFIQSAGTHSVTQTLAVGDNANTTGFFALSSGTLQVGSTEFVGRSGVGTFVQSGGSNSAAGLQIGVALAGMGSYSLNSNSGPATLTVVGTEDVGFLASSKSVAGVLTPGGTFIQAAGTTHTVSGILVVANSTVSSGLFTLSGGALTVNGIVTASGASASEFIGVDGTATFSQIGGSNTMPSGLAVALESPSHGSYSLGGAGVLSVGGAEYIGNLGGTGTFSQTSGTHTIGTDLVVAGNNNSTGTFSLAAGSLTVNGQEYIGRGSLDKGTFTQTGGTHTIDNNGFADTLFIGNNASSLGSYALNSTSSPATLLVQGNEYVGYSATGGTPAGVFTAGGTFTQSGGAHTIDGALILGSNASSTGAFTLSGGTLNVLGTTLGISERIGFSGNATFTQTGGTHSVAANLMVGGVGKSVGLYTLGNTGILNVGGTEIVGENIDGSGTFIQTGGTHTIGGDLTLTQGKDNVASFQLSGSGVVVVAGNENVDGFGSTLNETFIQNGGAQTIGGNLNLLDGSLQGIDTFTLGAGSTMVTGSENIGGYQNGNGAVFTQTGGTNTCLGPLTLGVMVEGGLYTLSGTGQLTVGGTLTISQLSNGFTGVSIFTLSGGKLTTAGLNLNGANQGFVWTGGSLFITSSVTWDPNAGTTATGSIFGSALTLTNGKTLMVGGNETLGGTSSFSLTLNSGTAHVVGGTLSLLSNGILIINPGSSLTANFLQNGGTLLGAVSNPGNFVFQGGLFNSQYTNDKTFTMAGGILGLGSTNAQLTNNADGTIIGQGTIAIPFTSSGIVVVSGGTLTLPAFTNNGDIEVSGSGATLAGGPIANASTLEGNGSVSAAITNNGTIEATSGTLIFTGALITSANKTLRAATGNKILVQTGLAANTGIIALAGGTFDNAAHTLTNTGQITGYGILSTGGLTNSANLDFSAGITSIYGTYTAAGGGAVTVSGGGAATFYNSVTLNAGSNIQVSQNSTVVFFAPVTGAGTITGPGTKDFENGGSLLSSGFLSAGPTFVQSPASLTIPYIRGSSLTLYGNTTITADGGSGGASKLTSISFLGGTLDLSNNDLILESTAANLATDYASLRSAIISASAGGPGLKASLATGTLTGLALVDNTDLPQPYSAARPFDGLPADASSILVKFTYIGDANLDGIINIDDYLQLDTAFREHKPATYVNGDFNYDGSINGLDYAYIDANYALHGGPLADGMVAAHTAEFGQSYVDALNSLESDAVPEPATLAVLAAGAIGLLSRRRRR